MFSPTFATRSRRGTYAYVVDRSGQLLYQPDPGRGGEVASADQVVRSFKNAPRGGSSVIEINGREYMAGYVAMPGIEWGVVLQSPASNVDDP